MGWIPVFCIVRIDADDLGPEIATAAEARHKAKHILVRQGDGRTQVLDTLPAAFIRKRLVHQRNARFCCKMFFYICSIKLQHRFTKFLKVLQAVPDPAGWRPAGPLSRPSA